MPTRLRPSVEATVYDEADADPVVTDHGLGWWDNLEKSHEFGAVTYSGGRATLEYIRKIGLVCRPFPVFADLRLTHVTTPAGTWSETLPVGIGGGNKYRLVQSDTTAGVVYSLKSTYACPQNANYLWTLHIWDTPNDHNITTYPPRVRLIMGYQGSTPAYCVELNKGEGNVLCRWIAGQWVPVMSLPGLADTQDNTEGFVLVRVLRGAIAVSMDRGANYAIYVPPDGSVALIPEGQWGLEGQGSGLVVGFHQVTFTQGVYTSPTRNSFKYRVSAPTVTITARKNTPGSTAVNLADAGTYQSAIARYTATLVPATTVAAVPFNWHHTPELYTVTYRISQVATVVTQASSTIPATQIIGVQIQKPLDLSESEATLIFQRPASTGWSGNYRHRKIKLRLGWYNDDTSYTWYTAFVGYVMAQRVFYPHPNWVEVQLSLGNWAYRLRRCRWAPFYEIPLGGQLLNDAMDHVLTTEGIPLNSSYRIWHARGNAITLPEGLAEDPSEMTRRGESKWDTLVRIASYAGLVMAISDDGVIQTVLPNYESGTTHDFYCRTGASTDDQIALGLDHETDYRDLLTAVYVTGSGDAGDGLIAYAVDTGAEDTTTANRFNPWRESVLETVPATTSAGLLALKAQGLASEHFGLKRSVEVNGLYNPAIGRRDTLRLYGATHADIPDATQHLVLSSNLTMQVDPSSGDVTLESTLGGRRK